MEILIANNAGFCFGVKRAVKLAEKTLNENKNNEIIKTNKDTDNKINDVKKDNTTAKGRLPQTGESLIIISSLLVIGLATIFGIRIYNKNFRGI